ncbi:MAG: phosphatase PAP2 family protein, partial [Acidimicrobiales bacterium]
MLHRVQAFDAAVDAAFDQLRGRPNADRLFYAASALGDHSLVWLLLGGLRGLRHLGSPRSRRAAVRLGLTLALESALVNGAIKSIFRRHRPTFGGPRPHYVRQPRTSSFPSGHASSAACAIVLMADEDPAWPLYLAVVLVVSASRVHVRIHHASD